MKIATMDTGVVYQDKITTIMWLPGRGGYWHDGTWATAVMIELQPSSVYIVTPFHVNDHEDLQTALDEHFGKPAPASAAR